MQQQFEKRLAKGQCSGYQLLMDSLFFNADEAFGSLWQHHFDRGVANIRQKLAFGGPLIRMSTEKKNFTKKK